MKALIFSDIHGSAKAARFIKEQVEKELYDAIFLLGDILYHGPRNPLPEGYDPKTTAALLNEFADMIIAVGGNCDSEVDTMLLAFPVAPVFSWCHADGVRLFLTHGHKFGPENVPPLREGDVLLFGHTHVPMADTVNGIYRCNPGSISLPKEGQPCSYGILAEGTFSVLTTNNELYLHLVCC